MTFIEAAQKVLKDNNNVPMTAREIWDVIIEMDLIESFGKTPVSSLQYQIQKSSINTKYKTQYKNKFFEITSDDPQKFKLIDSKTIKSNGFKVSKFNKLRENEKEKRDMTFKEAAKEILQKSGKPMTTREIWNGVKKEGLVDTSGKTPQATLNTIMLSNSINSKINKRSTNPIFKIVSKSPTKYALIDDVESEEIPKFNQFKEEVKKRENPFKQAICVLGESGAGKSVTIGNILKEAGHEFKFIIPSASTTGLLSQFSPVRSKYVLSKLGKMIIEAYNNPSKFYTAVFDEMHKPNTIEMINDELLQAISTKRNMGRRFISLDPDTSELYDDDKIKRWRGNILIPDNLGFLFISSKTRIITNNTDFFNRVDIVVLKSYEEEEIKSIPELLNKKLSREEKRNL